MGYRGFWEFLNFFCRDFGTKCTAMCDTTCNSNDLHGTHSKWWNRINFCSVILACDIIVFVYELEFQIFASIITIFNKRFLLKFKMD